MFFLQELSPITKWINYIMGTLAGWWLGEEDGRLDVSAPKLQLWMQWMHACYPLWT